MMKVNSIKVRVLQILTAATLCSGVSVVGFEQDAQAQEILLTGPLAGAPSAISRVCPGRRTWWF